MYDVIIVGARCAGSPTAMLLARKGHRVLLVDKAEFPSDTLSSHFIHVPGAARLARWGLLERVAASNCPPVRRLSIDFGPFALEGTPPAVDGIDAGYGPRRTVLDAILVEAAVAAGAELRQRFVTEEVLVEGGRVVGIRGRAGNRASTVERARVVVGADGTNSVVARGVGAQTYLEKPGVACAYYTYWRGVSFDGAELYPRDRRFLVAFPTNDDLVCTLIEWPRDEFADVRKDVEGRFHEALELAPRLAGRLRKAERAERFAGTGDLPNYFRRSHGPGWALVGDAGHRKDPNGAHGISDAFRDAEQLALAIDAGLSGARPLEQSLAQYESERDRASLPAFELNHQFATLQPPPPEMQALLGALRDRREDTDRFLGALVGSLPLAEFFAPENLQRIVGAAAAR